MSRKTMRARSTRYSEAGASMFEILISFLVIAIIMAFALPAVSRSISAYNLRSSADHLAERISAVRALAMAKNRNVTFSFNNASGRYGFDFTGTDGDGVPDTSDPADTMASYYVETLPEPIAATFPNNNPIKVTFNSRGELPIGTAEQSIGVHNTTATTTVRVNLRGKVTVE